jgi:intracellular multiplication protein IcmO
MVRREFNGPQDRHEQRAGAIYRDVRPTTVKLANELKSSGSGLILLGVAGATWWWPALVDLTVPLSLAYATWVLTRRVLLPLHLPLSARRKDYNNPDPKDRKPRQAAGALLLGRDAITGQELWLSCEAARQHATIPGTTGAGKTTAILSMLANALAHGSGFILVDGKADNRLYGDVLALARRFGREDDVLALNFLVASGDKDSNSFNPFAVGNADAIRELLVSQLGEQQSNDSNGVFRARATALIGTVAPVLTWMRDNYGVPISIETIRFCLELRWISTLARHRIFMVRNTLGGNPFEYKVPEMPEDLVYPLQAYLGELPGYDSSIEWNQQKENKPAEQHGYALMYFTSTFTQLAVSLGHIFKTLNGDVDMRDVVLNRRILVVNLPALENSDDTLAALGKIVVAALRGVLAQLLGARLDGNADEIFNLKPGTGDAPFQIVFDELAYYATSGLDRMLAMGRGLNVMFWLSFQEISGMWARIGEKTNSLLGNANLTIAMRQQDVSRTREWLEKTAGQANVAQATSFEGGSTGNYREGRNAEIRQTARIDWLELQRLIEGEAILLYGGRRIYAKVFHAMVEVTGRPIRRAQPIMLAAPAPDAARDVGAPVRMVMEELRRAPGVQDTMALDPDPVFAALLRAFKETALAGGTADDCTSKSTEAALQAAIDNRPQADSIGKAADEPPETPLSRMLRDAAQVSHPPAAQPVPPRSPVDMNLVSSLTSIERLFTSSVEQARRNAFLLIGERDFALAPTEQEILLEIDAPEMLRRIEKVRGLVAV